MRNNLYEIFSDKWVHNGGTIWLYSDPHFGDEEIKSLRSNCIDDNKQVKRINSKVSKNDTIIFLGDIGDLEYIKKIKGYKVLIMGNHEKGASNYKREYEEEVDWTGQYEDDPEAFNKMKKDGWIIEDENYTRYYSDSYAVINAVQWKKVKDNHLFDEVYEGPLMINDRLILSHEPIEGLPKYMFNIHGHDHANKFSSSKHLNVCAENIDYTPVNLLSLLKTGLLKDVENIHRACIDKATKEKRKKELKNVDKKLKQLYNK